MKKIELNFNIELDEDKIPEKIIWNSGEKDATEKVSKAIAVSIWDEKNNNTLRIDQWTKEMTVFEMKRFCIDTIGGLGQSILSATGDEFMAGEMNQLCEKFVRHVKNEGNTFS